MIETEITPKLEEFREKKRVLLEYQKIISEKENLEKIVVAHNYSSFDEKAKALGEKLDSICERKKHLDKKIKILNEEQRESEERIKEVTADRLKVFYINNRMEVHFLSWKMI